MAKMYLIFFTFFIILFNNLTYSQKNTKVINLTSETFRTKVYDYKNSKEWKYKGDKPAIIDFYADWCAPCRIISPYMDEISIKYANKIYVYKVNIDQEKEVTKYLGIYSIPTVLFVPLKGQPQVLLGAHPKSEYYKLINNFLNVQ